MIYFAHNVGCVLIDVDAGLQKGEPQKKSQDNLIEWIQLNIRIIKVGGAYTLRRFVLRRPVEEFRPSRRQGQMFRPVQTLAGQRPRYRLLQFNYYQLNYELIPSKSNSTLNFFKLII